MRENLRRIGHFEDFQLLPIVPSPDPYHYGRAFDCTAARIIASASIPPPPTASSPSTLA